MSVGIRDVCRGLGGGEVWVSGMLGASLYDNVYPRDFNQTPRRIDFTFIVILKRHRTWRLLYEEGAVAEPVRIIGRLYLMSINRGNRTVFLTDEFARFDSFRICMMENKS